MWHRYVLIIGYFLIKIKSKSSVTVILFLWVKPRRGSTGYGDRLIDPLPWQSVAQTLRLFVIKVSRTFSGFVVGQKTRKKVKFRKFLVDLPFMRRLLNFYLPNNQEKSGFIPFIPSPVFRLLHTQREWGTDYLPYQCVRLESPLPFLFTRHVWPKRPTFSLSLFSQD